MISSRNTAHFASTRKQGKIPQAACCWPSSKARTTYPVAERTKAVTHSRWHRLQMEGYSYLNQRHNVVHCRSSPAPANGDWRSTMILRKTWKAVWHSVCGETGKFLSKRLQTVSTNLTVKLKHTKPDKERGGSQRAQDLTVKAKQSWACTVGCLENSFKSVKESQARTAHTEGICHPLSGWVFGR